MGDMPIINEKLIQNKIYTVRGIQVMFDRDLAELYDVETKRVNEAVKNNEDKFPSDFYFQLSDDEFNFLRSKISTTDFSKVRVNPKVFTEQGIYMLATILKSKIATNITLSIIRTFSSVREIISSNREMFHRFERLEERLLLHDSSLESLFSSLEDKSLTPKQGIFYDGQMFDAYKFISDLIRNAKSSITLIDNYIDDTVLTLFSVTKDIKVVIYTKNISKKLQLDLDKYNSQYSSIEIKQFSNAHDRFMIIDENEIYHIGASLKDLGKKWFAFSKFDKGAVEILGRFEG